MRLDKFQYDDFRLIADLGPDRLHAVVERLRQLEVVPARPDKLHEAAVEALGDRQDAAEAIVREALMVYGWIRQNGLDALESQEFLSEAIKANCPDAEFERWQTVEEPFAELVALPILRLVAVATDLSYEYTNLWAGVRIITDIRPIFSQDATDIDGAVVSHSFRLRFENMDGRHELNIAMDESDIKELAKQCDRALRKAHTARTLMADRANVPTLIAGGSVDDEIA